MKQKEKTIQAWVRLKGGAERLARLFRPIAAYASAHVFPLQILLILVYRLALDLLYLKAASPMYAYDGFTTDVQPVYYGCTLLAVLIFSPFVVQLQKETPPSARIVTFLNYIYFIPLTCYCGCYGAAPVFFVIGMAYWALLLLFQFRLPVLELKKLPVRHAHQVYLALTILSSAFVMFISGRYTGFRFTLDFINVYDIRREAAGYSMPAIFSYALSMMNIMLAFLLLYWLRRKKYLIAAVLMVVYLFLFSIGALKSFFFYLLLLLAGYFLYRPWMLRWLGGLLTLLAALALAVYRLVGNGRLVHLFFLRLMFLVNQLGEQYMEFFSDNPLSLFRDFIMGKLPGITPVYTTVVPKIMGEFRGHIGEGANNGLLGDLFANLPALMGIFLLPLILVVCFRLLDAAAHHLPEKLTIATYVYFAVSFSNGFWSTVLLTHGFLLACLLFYFFPKEEKLSS